MFIFLDTEFTNLKRPDLISLALVCEDGREFYAERNDFYPDHCSDFVNEIVLPLLGRAPGAACTRKELTDRVAAQRRAVPPGGAVPKDYAFVGENGPVSFSGLFGDKQTLAVYSYMYGPKREQPCPMCTSLMAAWDSEALDVEQHIALVMVARSPIERLVAVKKERGWHHLRLYSDVDGDFTRDYVSAEDADVPGFNVFTRRDGSIRHFWSGEMGATTADPGQDPRGAPDLMPLWTILDNTPEGRGGDWYPSLSYDTR